MCDFLTKNLYWIIPLIITTVFSILTVILTVQNIKIMKHQEKLQNDAFCFQLFDRRLTLYDDIKNIISNIIVDDSVPITVLSEFQQKTRDIIFLFDQDVSELCNEIYNNISRLHTIKTVLDGDSRKGERDKKLATEENELLVKISDDGKHLSELVKQYISFEKYRTI